MPLLIDGHNLIGVLPGLSLEDPDDEWQLVQMLVPYRGRTGKAMTVVFDPGPAPWLPRTHRLGGIEVVFAPQGGSADGLILGRVQHSRNPQRWLVVTSDRELSDAAARLGARVQGAEAFAARLAERGGALPDRKESPPSPEEVEAWLALFNGNDGKHRRRRRD